MCNDYARLRALLTRWKLSVDRRNDEGLSSGIFPDMPAAVIRRMADGGLEALNMRWGFPQSEEGGRPVTNARHLKSDYWQPWLGPDNRCLVPATSFCEPTDTKPNVWHWFALDETRPLFAFPGLWRPWSGARGTKKAPIVGDHLLFTFLTTFANADVKPVHRKAMPVILTCDEDCERWLTAPADEALKMQRPLAAGALKVVARGDKEDKPADASQPGLPL
jgi:putative SOS response-associated peptidase YedK